MNEKGRVFMFRLERSHMLTPAPRERMRGGPIRAVLYFLAVFGMSSVGQLIIEIVALAIEPDMSDTVLLLVELFSTSTMVAAVILWCRFFERRDACGMGFTRRGAVSEYLIGAVGGIVLFSGAVAICVALGIGEITAATRPPSWWFLSLFLVAFLIQGLSEELLCRSLLMLSLARSIPLWACVVINASAFSALHLLNPGISPLALVNIFLFGVLASVLMLRRGSIWMVAALHSLWNFAQGNLFGIPVSGIEGSPSPFMTVIGHDAPWKVLIGGGDFGIEGGLAATAVLLFGIVISLLLPTKKSEFIT